MFIIAVSVCYKCQFTKHFLFNTVAKSAHSDAWYLSRAFLMCGVCIVILLPICLPKSLKVLSYTRYCTFFFHSLNLNFSTVSIVT